MEDLTDVLRQQRIQSSEVSVLEVSNVFVKKKGLNVEELFQMNNLMMQLVISCSL
jgi:hypothetical protein